MFIFAINTPTRGRRLILGEERFVVLRFLDGFARTFDWMNHLPVLQGLHQLREAPILPSRLVVY